MARAARCPRGEEGQLAPAVAIFMLVLVLAGLGTVLVPVGAATDERARAQTAADAAALAGAGELRRAWLDDVVAPGLLRFGGEVPELARGLGGGQAASYAAANGAELVGYAVVPGRGRATARVRGLDPAFAERGSARASATAELGVDLDDCAWDDPEPEEGEEPFERTLECDGLEITYRIAERDGALRAVGFVGTSRAQLLRALEPRLVDEGRPAGRG